MVCSIINRYTPDTMHGNVVLGTIGGIAACAAAPAIGIGITALEAMGFVVTAVGAGACWGAARHWDATKTSIAKLKKELAEAASQKAEVTAAALQQWNSFFKCAAWATLSGGVGMVCRWHENQLHCAEEKPDAQCDVIRPMTIALVTSTVACTYLGGVKLVQYRKERAEELKLTAKQEQLTKNIEEAEKRNTCIIS